MSDAFTDKLELRESMQADDCCTSTLDTRKNTYTSPKFITCADFTTYEQDHFQHYSRSGHKLIGVSVGHLATGVPC